MGKLSALEFFIIAIVILGISAVITALIFYPLVKNNNFLIKNKFIFLIISLIFFIVSLISFGRNFDTQQDPNYDPNITSNMLLVSWCSLSVSLFLIFFIHKKV